MKRNGDIHEEVSGTQSKGYFKRERALKDREGLDGLKKGGGGQAQQAQRLRREQDKAEMESYRLHGKRF